MSRGRVSSIFRASLFCFVPFVIFRIYGDFLNTKCLSNPFTQSLQESRPVNSTDDSLVERNGDLIRARPKDLQLVFVGDSVTRFQYLSLIHWLQFGRWLDKTIDQDSLLHAHSFHHKWHPQDDWNEFFLHSNRMFFPNEACDCWRETVSASGDDQPQSIRIERRYFREPTRNNTIVFINLYGNETDSSGYFRGYLPPANIWSNFTPGIVGGSNQSWHRDPRNIAWQYSDWSELLLQHVSNLSMPDASVILNAGLHGHNLNEASVADRLEAVLKRGIRESWWKRVVWKTSSITRDSPSRTGSRLQLTTNRNDVEWCQRLECLNISWTTRLRDEFYLDRYHFVEPIYRLLNEQLLAFLDALPPGYRNGAIQQSDVTGVRVFRGD